ncbi:MAG: ROK family protein [Pirellulaceae bacterium]
MSNEDQGKCWIGFDLGGTKMLSQVFDAKFYPLSRRRAKTNGHEGAAAGLERIADLIRSTLDETKLSKGELGGIGVGCPGPLDLNDGVIIEAPNLGWKEVRIREYLEKAFDCPVIIMNDVDAGVYGEFRFGAARGARCVVGVFPGTGIGGGCVYEGRVLRGSTGSCFEVGHMQIAPDGPLCGCGRRGCLEAVASRLAISSAAIQAAYRGDAPHLLKEVGMDLSKVRSKALLRSIQAGDKVIEEIIKNAARSIGIAVGNLVNLLLPDTIVLGGGLVEAMPDLFLENVRKAAAKRVMPSFVNAYQVVDARLGDEATVMGAAAWANYSVEHLNARKNESLTCAPNE